MRRETIERLERAAMWLGVAQIVVLILGAASSVRAADWSTETVIEESVYQALHVIDSAQTVYISKHEPLYYEARSAWIIGKYPTESRVIQFMAADALIHVTVTTALVDVGAPRWVTRTWELLTIANTGDCVGLNFHIGIKARF